MDNDLNYCTYERGGLAGLVLWPQTFLSQKVDANFQPAL